MEKKVPSSWFMVREAGGEMREWFRDLGWRKDCELILRLEEFEVRGSRLREADCELRVLLTKSYCRKFVTGRKFKNFSRFEACHEVCYFSTTSWLSSGGHGY